MSLSYRRRRRLLPGVTGNLSTRGVSASLGVKHAHVTVGRRKSLSLSLLGFIWRKTT